MSACVWTRVPLFIRFRIVVRSRSEIHPRRACPTIDSELYPTIVSPPPPPPPPPPTVLRPFPNLPVVLSSARTRSLDQSFLPHEDQRPRLLPLNRINSFGPGSEKTFHLSDYIKS